MKLRRVKCMQDDSWERGRPFEMWAVSWSDDRGVIALFFYEDEARKYSEFCTVIGKVEVTAKRMGDS